MRTSSLNNNKYFILFIDNYSRMTWVYFMKERSEVFEIFQKLKNLVVNQSGLRLKLSEVAMVPSIHLHNFKNFVKKVFIDNSLFPTLHKKMVFLREKQNNYRDGQINVER